MKKAIFCFSLLAFTLSAIAQKTDTQASYTEADIKMMYRHAKGKKAAAAVMVGVGSAAIVTGIVMMTISAIDAEMEYEDGYDFYNSSLFKTGAVTTGAGLGITLGSIPVWRSAHKTRKNAMRARAALNAMFIPSATGGATYTRIPQPAFTLSLPLGR